MKYFAFTFAFIALCLCSCQNTTTTNNSSAEPTESTEVVDSNNVAKGRITKEMAMLGVNNYCHKNYDWSVAEDNPDMMFVELGEETETEYQVTFRSYTGAFVYFYVDKTSGTTRMVEHVPSMNIKNELGTMNLSDYLE